MNEAPSTNGSNGSPGRDWHGRFAKGWKGGPGNPHARQVARLRSIILEETSEEDLRIIWRNTLKMAKCYGFPYLPFVREVLDRLLGKPGPMLADESGDSDPARPIFGRSARND